jgi:hypothetical protein
MADEWPMNARWMLDVFDKFIFFPSGTHLASVGHPSGVHRA